MKIPRTMSRKEADAAVQAFLDNGGEVIQLREATKKDQAKASRKAYHQDRAMSGSQRSIEFLEKEKKREASFIFSRTERESEV